MRHVVQILGGAEAEHGKGIWHHNLMSKDTLAWWPPEE